jgi:xanthine dehydrogenase accessory factor
MADRMDALDAARVPFVSATVVRAEQPTSARPGDDAVVFADGTMEGFVGGHCARESVRTAALASLDSGEPLLLRVLPGGEESFPEAPGAKVTVNPCLSGGALEIFLHPHIPPAVISVVGTTPIADSAVALIELLGFTAVRTEPDQATPGAVATIICSLGDGEEPAIQHALAADVGFIAVVASERRGNAVVSALGLTDSERNRIHVPAGLGIGAQTPPEIALAILAQIVQAIRVDGLAAPGEAAHTPPQQALDPICGMTVTVMPQTPHLAVDGVDHWFCNPSCRDTYAQQVAS